MSACIQDTDCCGIGDLVIRGFASAEHIFRAIEEGAYGYEDDPPHDWGLDKADYSALFGALIAVTTQSEKRFHSPLRQVGFRPVRTFNNPNTGNSLTLWSMTLPKRRKTLIARRKNKKG